MSPIAKKIELLNEVASYLSKPFVGNVNYVAAPEANGWIVGLAVANELNVGFIPVRKGGGFSYPRESLISKKYVDYSKVEKTLEIKDDFIESGDKILLVDEWIETGASMNCCIELFQSLGGIVIGIAAVSVNYKVETKRWVDSGFVHYIARDKIFYGETTD
ncbi:MAG: adenine phosphoribosyltransferase [Oscillospiraceae bacterium]|nr:adenine phosphoribosyltransferase [Oscillospiraceae bacterium]